MSKFYDQSRSENSNYNPHDLGYIKNINIVRAYKELKEKQEMEETQARLEEIGNGRYAKISSDYRLLFHISPNSEEETDLKEKLLEIIANESDIYSLKSIYYGLFGEFGNRKIKAYIASKNLPDEEVRLIGYNDYTYLDIVSPGILSQNTSYMEGYQKAAQDRLLSIITSNTISKNEVAISLQNKLASLNKKHHKR